jgi:hypothetical protein
MTPLERDGDGAEVRLSTGMAVRVRESHEDVLARLGGALQAGASGIITLTREDGAPVHLVAGHVVLIEPKPGAGREPTRTPSTA